MLIRSFLPLPIVLLTLLSCAFAHGEDALPKTLMTTRGKLLVSEDFAGPLAPLVGAPKGFASGFTGWRHNGSLRSGHFDVVNGVFQGRENPEAHHPATASLGVTYKDAIIQCELALDDIPAIAGRGRYAQVKATDEKDYVCALSVGQGGMSARIFDSTEINPVSKQRKERPAAQLAAPVKLGEWHTVVLEIKGDEAVGTLDGKSVTFSYPLIGSDKHSVMLVAGTGASFRKLRIWEALPNEDWVKNKEALLTDAKKPTDNSTKPAH